MRLLLQSIILFVTLVGFLSDAMSADTGKIDGEWRSQLAESTFDVQRQAIVRLSSITSEQQAQELQADMIESLIVQLVMLEGFSKISKDKVEKDEIKVRTNDLRIFLSTNALSGVETVIKRLEKRRTELANSKNDLRDRFIDLTDRQLVEAMNILQKKLKD
jgi:hypothetical protein